jgi:hypothetical protein
MPLRIDTEAATNNFAILRCYDALNLGAAIQAQQPLSALTPGSEYRMS